MNSETKKIKIFLTIFLISLLIVVRTIFWRDTSSIIAGLSLFIMLTSMYFITLFVTRSYKYNMTSEQADSSIPPQAVLSSMFIDRHKKLSVTEQALFHSYYISLAQTNFDLSIKVNYVLNLLLETMPDKIFAVFTYNDSDLLCVGANRLNSRHLCEVISSEDTVISELSTKIKGCIELRSLKKLGTFETPITFARSKNNEDGLIIPILLHNKCLAIFVALATETKNFSKNERYLLNNFCDNLAILLDNHSIFQTETVKRNDLAENFLTRKLLKRHIPETVSSIAGWDISQRTAYCDEYGGDFHIYIPLTSDRMLILAGHTSNNGLNSALFLNSICSMISCFIESYQDPAEILNQLSAQIASNKSFDLFTSMIAIELKSNSLTIRLAIAGHALPLINRPRSGYVELPQLTYGVPLGLFNHELEPYGNQNIQLLPGDGILIYTDGAIDFVKSEADISATEELRLMLDRILEQPSDILLTDLTKQLIPENFRKRPLNDYTLIYARTE